MKLCRITILAFIFGDIPKGIQNGYTNIDLENGIDYCNSLIELGYAFEPMDKFNLRDYIEWAKKLISDSEQHST